MTSRIPWLLLAILWVHPGWCPAAEASARTSASSASAEGNPEGAMDGDRFRAGGNAAWAGRAGEQEWWWRVDFTGVRKVGGLLQIFGDHDFVFRNAPSRYVWEGSADGQRWMELARSAEDAESRLYRVFRLRRTLELRAVRLRVLAVAGTHPVLREVEFLPSTRSPVSFPEWVVAVNVTHDPALPGHGQEFIPLARRCDPGLQAQQVWLDRFTTAFLSAEPRPLCAFLSGSFKDWCEVDRTAWRGVERVLRRRELPMWASCGGAQGLGLVSEYGTAHPWDCPHCRDPKRPRTPLYGHIAHTGLPPACGDYSKCVFERGPHAIRVLREDPVFAGLPGVFEAMESHCGQLEWAPCGWRLLATAGAGTTTRMQCLRLNGAPIYAAQFHIEMAGTPAVSASIMGNFLEVARKFRPAATR